MMNKILPLFVLLILNFISISIFAQSAEKKQTTTFRTENTIKIDGILNESDWQKANVIDGLVQLEPTPGEPSGQKSAIKVIYDNQAIYVGATLYDTKPNEILQELSERDNMGNTDWFGLMIDAYQDGINGLGFYVTASGVQIDIKYSAIGGNGGGNFIFSGDTNWDAVWDSEVNFTEEGWVVEMKLPYSALRFPNKDEQVWNINFGRGVRRDRETSFWNPIDPNGPGFVQQAGVIDGIKNIKAPVRLSATPFVATYFQNYFDPEGNPKSSWGRSTSGGMDIKYGINDAFTLDMTLIPDFGEAQSDNQVLNLSPFEVRFDENRQFFTEGTELFNKGGLFYSRRIGGRPLHFGNVEDNLKDGEEIVSNPSETQLYNATKISGRTKKGLGIGFFNAVAGASEAIIKDTEGNERQIQTSPLTNYNVTVLDQNLKNNSYVSLVNTNVLRNGADYDANVTAVGGELKNKENSYGLSTIGKLSQKIYTDSIDIGHAYSIGLGKISGNFNWSVDYGVESHNYDPNDLGFLFSPNSRDIGFNMNFNVFKPFWGDRFNSGGVGMWTGYSRLQQPNVYIDYGINIWAWARTKNFTNFNLWFYGEPFQTYDYFEPRTDDFSRFYAFPRSFNVGGWISTDYRKKFAIDFNGNVRPFEEDGRYRINFGIAPRYRVNNKLSFRWRVNNNNALKDVGYVDKVDDDIIFGIRDQIVVENVFNTNYIFNNNMSLTFRLRHYWAKASYHSFHKLSEDGHLVETDYNEFNDNSFNAMNIDAVYRWRFAPGSDIFVIWKNSILGWDDAQDNVIYDYRNSINGLTNTPQTNSLSIKIIYFLDYLALTGKG